MKFFTADPHYYHSNIIEYSHRPFYSLKHMHDTLINNWNEKVGEKDTVYIIGDLSFRDPSEILDRLNGKKILLIGDHDKPSLKVKHKFEMVLDTAIVKFNKKTVYLNHWKNEVWPKSHYNSWHLYAHSHGHLRPTGKSWDAGVDNNNYYPLSEKDIEKIMDDRPDNFNLVKGSRLYE